MLDFMLPVAIALGVGVWPLILIWAALYIAVAVLAESQHWLWSTALLLLVVLGPLGAGHVLNPGWLMQHPWTVARWFGIWLAAGTVWGVFKWYWFCLKRRDEYEDRYHDWEAGRVTWEREHGNSFGYTQYYNQPKNPGPPAAGDNKERIITWMYLWPFSIAGTLFGDWLRRLFTRIYRELQTTLDRIAQSVWNSSDITKPTPPNANTAGGDR